MGKEEVLRTSLCDMLGIKYPIVLAGMGSVSGPTLVAAVSNAGGLGVLAGIDREPEELRDWIRKTKSLTDKPFGVDTVFPLGLPEEVSHEELRAQLPAEAVAFAEKLRQDIGAPRIKGRPAISVISRKFLQKQIDVIIEEGVPVLVSGLGNPGWAVPELHAHHVKVMGLVGTVSGARHLAESGVDIIIAQGHEAGGHTGRIGTMALVPQVVDAVHPVPVLAAGGIADGRGLLASLVLGAVGVWCGTVFVATHEACVDYIESGIYTQWEIDAWKKMILKATEENTRITRTYSGKTLRHIPNKFTQTWEQSGGPFSKQFPLQAVLISDIQEGVRRAHLADYVTWTPAGQISGMIRELRSAKEVVDDMVSGAMGILEKKSPFDKG